MQTIEDGIFSILLIEYGKTITLKFLISLIGLENSKERQTFSSIIEL